ncbi:MAG: COG3014 family protein [Thermodesulfobacteriota bacterium]
MRKTTIAFFCLLAMLGCRAAGPDYGKINRQLRSDRCPRVVDYIENQQSEYGRHQKLLYMMDSAMIHMNCGHYETANQYFHQAEQLAEKLWTKSVSKEAASFVWNEYTKPYDGEDFERVMINLFSALAYIEMGNYDEAMVECRRLNLLLNTYNDKYEKKNVYKEDAFARYLSGMLYEATGQPDDAFIDYFKAYQAFKDYKKYYDTPMPPTLVKDLCRVAAQVDRLAEVEKAGVEPDQIQRQKFPDTQELGKVVFIHFMGAAPRKVENRITIPTKGGPVKIAFPGYKPNPPSCSKSRLVLESSDGQVSAASHLMEDINKIAVKNLKDRKARVMAKVVARAAAKQVVIHQASEEAGTNLVKIGLNIANNFIERADTRCWRTLPGEIHLARTFVKPGKYRAFADVCHHGKTFKQTIAVKAGQTEFILCITRNEDAVL